jgi:death-on-curing protein
VAKFIIEMENTVVDVADNCIDRDLLKEIVTSILYDYDYSEELKMKIIQAKMNHLAKKNITNNEQ